MQKRRETKGLDQSQTVEQGKGRKTADNGRRNSYNKFSKGSNRKRRGNGRGRNAGGKQRSDRRQTAFKVSEVLSRDVINRLDALKERLK